MNPRTTILSLISIGVVGGATLLPWNSTTAAPASAAPQTLSTFPISSEIVGEGEVQINSRGTLTKTEGVTLVTRAKEVIVLRRERETETSTWYGQQQNINTSFYPVRAASRCGRPLYIAGAREDGSWVIEEWQFIAPDDRDSSGQYIPLVQRRPYGTRMIQLWSGSDRGQIIDIEQDPENRFLLVLTSSHSLFKFTIATRTWQLIDSASSLPQLTSMRSVSIREHATEGRKWILCNRSPAVSRVFGSIPAVMFSDADNDGSPDTHVVISTADWNSLGYGSAASWVEPCQ